MRPLLRLQGNSLAATGTRSGSTSAEQGGRGVGLLIARAIDQGRWERGLALCLSALAEDPRNAASDVLRLAPRFNAVRRWEGALAIAAVVAEDRYSWLRARPGREAAGMLLDALAGAAQALPRETSTAAHYARLIAADAAPASVVAATPLLLSHAHWHHTAQAFATVLRADEELLRSRRQERSSVTAQTAATVLRQLRVRNKGLPPAVTQACAVATGNVSRSDLDAFTLRFPWLVPHVCPRDGRTPSATVLTALVKSAPWQTALAIAVAQRAVLSAAEEAVDGPPESAPATTAASDAAGRFPCSTVLGAALARRVASVPDRDAWAEALSRYAVLAPQPLAPAPAAAMVEAILRVVHGRPGGQGPGFGDCPGAAAAIFHTAEAAGTGDGLPWTGRASRLGTGLSVASAAQWESAIRAAAAGCVAPPKSGDATGAPTLHGYRVLARYLLRAGRGTDAVGIASRFGVSSASMLRALHEADVALDAPTWHAALEALAADPVRFLPDAVAAAAAAGIADPRLGFLAALTPPPPLEPKRRTATIRVGAESRPAQLAQAAQVDRDDMPVPSTWVRAIEALKPLEAPSAAAELSALAAVEWCLRESAVEEAAKVAVHAAKHRLLWGPSAAARATRLGALGLPAEALRCVARHIVPQPPRHDLGRLSWLQALAVTARITASGCRVPDGVTADAIKGFALAGEWERALTIVRATSPPAYAPAVAAPMGPSLIAAALFALSHARPSRDLVATRASVGAPHHVAAWLAALDMASRHEASVVQPKQLTLLAVLEGRAGRWADAARRLDEFMAGRGRGRPDAIHVAAVLNAIALCLTPPSPHAPADAEEGMRVLMRVFSGTAARRGALTHTSVAHAVRALAKLDGRKRVGVLVRAADNAAPHDARAASALLAAVLAFGTQDHVGRALQGLIGDGDRRDGWGRDVAHRALDDFVAGQAGRISAADPGAVGTVAAAMRTHAEFAGHLPAGLQQGMHTGSHAGGGASLRVSWCTALELLTAAVQNPAASSRFKRLCGNLAEQQAARAERAGAAAAGAALEAVADIRAAAA